MHFLSRLCGGESDVDIDAAIDDFLSRLCGGEFKVKQLVLSLIFLSRLCGGESKTSTTQKLFTFSKPPVWR